MTQNNTLEGYIKDFKKVCKVSDIISQTCQIRGYDWLEQYLLNRWAKTVLDCQDKGEKVDFILAKVRFIEFLKRDGSLDGDSIKDFLIDTIRYQS